MIIPTNEQIDQILNRSSFNGLKALYILYCAYNSKKAFKAKELEKPLDLSYDTFIGFYSAFYCFGLFDFTDNNSIINVISLNALICDKIEKKIRDLAKEYDSTLKPEKLPLLSWEKEIEAVKHYFSDQPDEIGK